MDLGENLEEAINKEVKNLMEIKSDKELIDDIFDAIHQFYGTRSIRETLEKIRKVINDYNK